MNILQQICEKKKEHIAGCKQRISQNAMLAELEKSQSNFINNISAKISANEFALIAEIKKASPSKGIIRPNFNPQQIAQSYAKAGASCLSVLTDIPYFAGDDAYVGQAKGASGLPILRKDFMLDIYQIIEAKYIGSDAILLIMAALELQQAKELEAAAHELGLDVLIEVHNEVEMEQALQLKSPLIGVNNRDLTTLKVDMQTSKRLSELYPKGYIAVCESGINSHEDLLQMREYGYHTFLVGESLMKQDDIEMATRSLLRQ